MPTPRVRDCRRSPVGEHFDRCPGVLIGGKLLCRHAHPGHLLALAVVACAVVVAPQTGSAEAAVRLGVRDTPGPRGAIAVVGDSVMLGSAYEPPLFPGGARRWPDCSPTAAGARCTWLQASASRPGKMVPNNPGANMSLWLLNQRSLGFDPSVIVVSMGPNDIIGCQGNVECAADDIRGFVDTAGVDHEVWWALQTTEDPTNQDAWNQALQIVAAERPNLTLWDWPRSARPGIPMAADNTHLPGPSQYGTADPDRRRRHRPTGRV